MLESPRTPRAQTGHRILLAGTGGQGILLMAGLLTQHYASRGHEVVTGQLHGMSQRGGAVQSTVLVDCGIGPALRRGDADLVVGLEPLETARSLPYMSEKTIVFMNTCMIVPYVLSQQFALGKEPVRYPDVDRIEDHIRACTSTLFAADMTVLAREAGSVSTLNMIMLGCLVGSRALPSCREEDFVTTLKSGGPSRLREANQGAFFRGILLGRTWAGKEAT